MTTQEEIKKNLKNIRDKRAEAISEEELSKELGEGVEKDPVEPEKADPNFPVLNLTGATSIRHIIDELKQLPPAEDVTKQLNKIDAYEMYAKKIWKTKMAEQDSFTIPLRVIDRIDKRTRDGVEIERIIWKKDTEGNFITEPKTFKYNSLTIQDKDDILWLENDRDDAYYSVLEEGKKVDEMVKNTTTGEYTYTDYAKKRTWQGKLARWHKAQQDYWIELFKMYFNASDEDVKRIPYDDIVRYGEIALYISGVKSPKSEGS